MASSAERDELHRLRRDSAAMSRFGGNNRVEKRARVIERITLFFERFYGIGE